MAEENRVLLRTDEEQEAVRIFLYEVNVDHTARGLSPVDTATAVKFLMARKFDVERAVALYKQNQLQLREHHVLPFYPYEEPLRSELLSGKFTVLDARDSGGSAIAVFLVREHHPSEASHATVIQDIIFQLDEALKSHVTQEYGLVLILDMTKSSYWNFDYELSRKVLKLLQGGYPAKLKHVYVVSPPFWFRTILLIMTSFVREKFRERLQMVSLTTLKERLPESSVPSHLGGTLAVDHAAWLNQCLASFEAGGGTRFSAEPTSQGKSDMFGDLSCTSEVLTSPIQLLAKCEQELVSEGGMSCLEFVKHVRQKGKSGLKYEYNALQNEPDEGIYGATRIQENLRKNRYSDVHCYEHTRVRLQQLDNDVHSDYIHANFVDGYKQAKAFIATQGPMQNTVNDFWRMVWEQGILIIVMTTRIFERGRVKCIKYWPENGEKYEFGIIEVTSKDTKEFEDHIVRKFNIKNTRTGDMSSILHFQMTSWPDFGVPSSAESCLHVLNLVRRAQADSLRELGNTWHGHVLGPPILVHCSAGIGRTGTFCTIDINLQRLADDGKCEVHNTVWQLRQQRAHMIQTPEQYQFCHVAILEHTLTLPSTSEESKECILQLLEEWKMGKSRY